MGEAWWVKVGDEIEARGMPLGPDGQGRARAASEPALEIIVPGLLPDERALLAIRHMSRHHRRAHAELISLQEAAPSRREPPCPHQGNCTGCPLMIATVQGQADAKKDQLAAQGLLVDQVVQQPEAELGYRWSAKRVVGGAAGALILGSYRRGSHEIADMSGCLVDHPDITRAADEIAQVGSELAVDPYCEDTGAGTLRYVWLKTDGKGAVLVTLIAARHPEKLGALARALEAVSGVAVAVQSAKGNAIRGEQVEIVAGEGSVTIALCESPQTLGPMGFLQPNPLLASRCYRDLVDTSPSRPELSDAPENRRLALDLYAGAGITTALLQRTFSRVLACESYPESARALGVAPMKADDFLAGLSATGEQPELVLANPPRAGLGSAVCQALNELAEASGCALHIMSCNAVSLMRDLATLTGPDGAYDLRLARAYDTLPQTAHIEIVAWLTARE